ncbi:alanine/glycine:cation symporter family protein [Peptoniphilus raoultii]|uniref:alanine/glycine:cation symporter family protein n=1 Tax=Peptoniphilus raoultii TaxID=1776387 RepID=UPI0008DA3614|nr:alanine/glycine:cation symporter family protein [Peptoniphilus raoultii]
MVETLKGIIEPINNFIYYPLLVVLLLCIGLYFTIRTKFLQGRLLKEAINVVMEKPEKEGAVSSFQALMVSTASRVGTGNIVGVSTAICLGGYGAVFWMWIVAIIGGASAFIESTLAQMYKKRDNEGNSYGGPSYYIEQALKSRTLGVVFSISLIATYAIGFNMLAAFNLQTSFMAYSFYDPKVTPWIIGVVLALITAYCILGGGKRIIKFTSTLVPIMGVIYIIVAILMIILNISCMPTVFSRIFSDAFNFKAIFGAIASSSMMYGIKRGLYSNEAGIGSAPNAAASADVSHPVKQGLVQMLSVFIDTLLICSATAFMCLSSGVEPNAELSGAPYVQKALTTFMGSFGNHFICFSLVLFAFTTLIGNLFYVDTNLAYINGKQPSKNFMIVYRIIAAIIILFGATQEATLAWDISDLLMGIMAIINLPTILILGNRAIACLKDYEKQKKTGRNPVFHSADIGISEKLDYWS